MVCQYYFNETREKSTHYTILYIAIANRLTKLIKYDNMLYVLFRLYI